MIRSIIIEDEVKSSKLLAGLINTHCPNVEVLASADSVSSGFDAFYQHNPDLIFLDIVMPKRNGFQLLEKIKDFDIEVIFTTAHDQYAVKAIKFSALDYLLKPINVEDLQRAVKKVELKLSEKHEKKSINERLNVFLENANTQTNQKKIGLPTQNGINFLPIKEILLCKAEGNYSIIYMTENGEKEIYTRTLKEIEDLLSESNFIRVHRSYLINLDHLKKYYRTNHSDEFDGDGGCAIMSNNLKVPVSRDKRKLLLNLFSKPF